MQTARRIVLAAVAELTPPESELVADGHDATVAEMHLDEFGAAHRVAVFVPKGRDVLSRLRIEDVGRMRPYVSPIETERHPPVTALR